MSSFMYIMVVVIRAETPMMSASSSSASLMMVATFTSRPRSTTSKPAVESRMRKMFLPMSWTSPCTVATTALPARFSAALSAGIAFSSTAMPAFIASAASIMSGRKRLPSSKPLPTVCIPGANPSRMAFRGSTPESTTCFASATQASASPLTTASVISLKSVTATTPPVGSLR